MRIRFYELNNELQRRQITATGSRRLSATNCNIWDAEDFLRRSDRAA